MVGGSCHEERLQDACRRSRRGRALWAAPLALVRARTQLCTVAGKQHIVLIPHLCGFWRDPRSTTSCCAEEAGASGPLKVFVCAGAGGIYLTSGLRQSALGCF